MYARVRRACVRACVRRARTHLNVAMEDAVPVHVVHRLEQLVHVDLDPCLGKVLTAAADELIDVHVHELEDERQAARRLVVENFAQLDDARVRRQTAQRLDFAQVVDLIQAVEVILHALDRDVLAILDALRL